MTLSNPLPDNPVDRSQTAGVRFPYQFTAKIPASISELLLKQLWLGTAIPVAICLLCIGVVSANIDKRVVNVGDALNFVWLGLPLFFLACLIRLWIAASWYSDAVTAVGWLACMAILPADAQLHGPVLSGLLLFWSASEFAYHWVTINPPSQLTHRTDFRQSIATGLIVANVTVLISVTMPVTSAYYCLGLVFINLLVGIVVWWGRGFRLWPIVRDGWRFFALYPEKKELVQGLIASPLGRRCFRHLPAGLFVVSYACASTQPFVGPESVDQVLAATGYGLLTLASLFTALIAICAMPVGDQAWSSVWQTVVSRNQQAPNKLRDSIFIGQMEADQSPVVVHRSLLMEHVHFLGSTGSGKTALGLIPLAEQIINGGDATLVVIDLKADKHEILASCIAASRAYTERTGKVLPVRLFSMEAGQQTHMFNPFLAPAWCKLPQQQQTEILCNSLGMNYGPGYGRSFYSDSGAALINAALRSRPEMQSFRELFAEIDRILRATKSSELLPELRRGSAHAWQLTARLATVDALNCTPSSSPAEVIQNQIDFSTCFETPQILFFRLPSTLAANTAFAIANLAAYSAIIAGQRTERKVKVHFMIDEFQRMAGDSLTQMFQMARSLDIGLILANQSQNDLRAVGKTIADAVEGGCAWRQWFSLRGSAEIAELAKLFGSRDEFRETFGGDGATQSWRQEAMPRATVNTLSAVSDDPNLSVLRIAGDRSGLARYGSLPFIVRSGFHVSQEEYERRKRFTWPSSLPGMMTSNETPISPGTSSSPKQDPHRPFDTWGQDLFVDE